MKKVLLTNVLSMLVLSGKIVSLQLHDPVNLALSAIAGIFALILTSISFYAWAKYKNNSLLLFSLAFFSFFVKILVDEIVPLSPFYSDTIASLIDFVTLSLFFVALILGARARRVTREMRQSTND